MDDALRATQTFHTDGNGDGCFTVTTPHPLILNSATEDTFRLVGTVDGHEFEFHLLVKKYISTDHSEVDSGASQARVLGATTANYLDTAKGGGSTDTQDATTTLQDVTQHQLVILCYGAGQWPGDNAGSTKPYDRPGMDQVYDAIKDSVAPGHILRFWSGDKADPFSPANALSLAKEAITNAIHLYGINSVVIAGYSWGGGMAEKLAEWFAGTGIEVAGLAYIDAVNHGGIGRVTELPSNVSSFLNVYQSVLTELPTNYRDTDSLGHWDDVPVESGDALIHPNPGMTLADAGHYYGRYSEIDADETSRGKVNLSTHTQVDNDKAGLVATFITGVLDEWFWAHAYSHQIYLA